MVQTSRYKWEIRSSKGFVLVTDIALSSKIDAIRYVEAYISSFNNWSYEIKELV